MVRVGALTLTLAVAIASLMAACGGSASSSGTGTAPNVGGTSTPSSAATPAAQAPTAAQLQAAAAAVYPACVAPTCATGAKFTTCDSGYSGQEGVMGDKLTTCPLSSKLLQQLESDTTGAAGAPDPLGGGEAEQFASESFTAVPGTNGGTVHAVLTLLGGAGTATTDLVFVSGGAKLVLDDLYCTGKDPATTGVYAAGWPARAICT